MTYSPPGTITGAGTANTICKFTAASVIGNSLITDDATTVTIATRTTLHAAVDVNNIQRFLQVTGTLPATPNVEVEGVLVDVTGAGVAARNQVAMLSVLRAGYTGSSLAIGNYSLCSSASTGTNLVATLGGNVGVLGIVNNATTGNCAAILGLVSNTGSGKAFGVLGASCFASAAGPHIGVMGLASSGSTTTGGFFALYQVEPSVATYVTSALVADNAAVAAPIALFRDNAVTKVAIADGGSLDLSAGTRWPISTKIADYPLTSNDITILADASALAITMTLPSATLHTGRMFNIKKIDATANAVTVASAGGLIDGLAVQTITAQWDSFTLQSNGTDWFII